MNQRQIEYVASALCVAAIVMGSSTRYGSLVGLVSCMPWWVLMFRANLWGILPANLAGTVAYAYNIGSIWL